MRPKNSMLLTLALAVAALLVPVSGARAAGTAAVRSCKQVDVEFHPDGGGSATKLKAKNVGCTSARRVARDCIKGKVRTGWSARIKGVRFIITKGDMRVSFAPAGGGGCVDLMSH